MCKPNGQNKLNPGSLERKYINILFKEHTLFFTCSFNKKSSMQWSDHVNILC